MIHRTLADALATEPGLRTLDKGGARAVLELVSRAGEPILWDDRWDSPRQLHDRADHLTGPWADTSWVVDTFHSLATTHKGYANLNDPDVVAHLNQLVQRLPADAVAPALRLVTRAGFDAESDKLAWGVADLVAHLASAGGLADVEGLIAEALGAPASFSWERAFWGFAALPQQTRGTNDLRAAAEAALGRLGVSPGTDPFASEADPHVLLGTFSARMGAFLGYQIPCTELTPKLQRALSAVAGKALATPLDLDLADQPAAVRFLVALGWFLQDDEHARQVHVVPFAGLPSDLRAELPDRDEVGTLRACWNDRQVAWVSEDDTELDPSFLRVPLDAVVWVRID